MVGAGAFAIAALAMVRDDVVDRTGELRHRNWLRGRVLGLAVRGLVRTDGKSNFLC